MKKLVSVLSIIFSVIVWAEVLPYKSARVDVFLKGSNLFGIEKEFTILSVDGRIKAIGRVSTGRGGATAARRWQIIGIEYYKRSKKHGNAPMPKAINLSKFGVMEQTGVFFHGSTSYGEFDGDAHSHGCIRLMTINDKDKDIFEDPGLHYVFWRELNPKGYVPDENDEGYKSGYLTFDSTSAEIKAYLQEMRTKITVYTHNANSLAKKSGWKEALERLYDVDLINGALDKTRKVVLNEGKNKRTVEKLEGYSRFDEPLSGTQLDVVAQIEAE